MLKKKSCVGMFIATSFIIVPGIIGNHETRKRIAQICSNMSESCRHKRGAKKSDATENIMRDSVCARFQIGQNQFMVLEI